MAERKDRALRWLEVATNIGIVCGLVLVSVQIAQEREIATESYDLEISGVGNEQQRHISGEEVATSLAKAISHPKELTVKDYVVWCEWPSACSFLAQSLDRHSKTSIQIFVLS